MSQIRNKFKQMVRRILKEEIQKRDVVNERVPEMDANGSDKNKDKNKRFKNHENTKDTKTKCELLDDLQSLVNNINSKYTVVWDDHDDLTINARDLMSFKITPDWEDHYEIVAFTRNEDRVWVTGLDWEQVKTFVKNNLSDAKNVPTYVEKAYDKSYRNRQDQTNESPKTNSISSSKVKEKKVGDSKNKEKDYVEDAVKNEEDLPTKHLRNVDTIKKQSDHKVKEPVKLRKKHDNPSHIAKKS